MGFHGKGVVLLSIVLMAASAHAQRISIASTLFATNARDVGPAHIYDRINPDGEIARVAYSPDGVTETHSIYVIDTRRKCIAVLREETWNRPPTKLQAVQTYPGAPCWIRGLTISPGQRIRTEIKAARWSWTKYDANGVAMPRQASGIFYDRTTLTADRNGQLHLLEYYDDPDTLAEKPYCMQGDYDDQGLARLSPGRC